MVDDELLRRLPQVPAGNPHAAEWGIRGRSLDRFLRYLRRNLSPESRILDLGSGNGWISHALSLQGYHVLGLEPGTEDLDQARRVFGEGERLQWLQGDLQALPRSYGFDLILMAASVQYFPSLEELCRDLDSRLHPGGSIHILDSVLYPHSQVESARQRSRDYYESLGFAEMAGYYHHHSQQGARRLGFRKLWPIWPFSEGLQWWARTP